MRFLPCRSRNSHFPAQHTGWLTRRKARGERAGIVFMKLVSPMLVGGLRKYRPMEAEDVARSMVSAAAMEGSGKSVYEYERMMALIKSARFSGFRARSMKKGRRRTCPKDSNLL